VTARLIADSELVRLAVVRHDAALAALRDGRVGEAQRLAADAIDAATAAFGRDSPDLANVMVTCALAHEEAGDFTAAQVLAERAAGVAAPLVDTEDDALVSLWVDIEVVCARLLSTLGAFALAEARLAAALAVASRVLALDDRSVLAIHNMRGVTAKYAGRFDEAEAHYERIRAILEAEPVTDADALAGVLHNLGGLDHSRGRVDEGLAHAERGLRLRIEAVGPDHPDVARDLNAIGALHHDAGDTTAAETAYRRALGIFETTLGADHYEVAMTCANLAVSTASTGDAVVARTLYERALRILESSVGAEHPDVALVQHNLAVMLVDQGDPDAAFDLLAQADAVLAATLPQDHPRRLDLLATVRRLSSSTRAVSDHPDSGAGRRATPVRRARDSNLANRPESEWSPDSTCLGLGSPGF
jgi:tetratricopeptide (TPR) repeat protein